MESRNANIIANIAGTKTLPCTGLQASWAHGAVSMLAPFFSVSHFEIKTSRQTGWYGQTHNSDTSCTCRGSRALYATMCALLPCL